METLIEKARGSDCAARRDIEARCVELQMPFARRVAHRYGGRGVASDDLDQVAYLGLLKAIRRFDRSRGLSFRNYALVTIRGELRRYFRDYAWTVRPPRSLQELQARVWNAESELMDSLRRSPSLPEIAQSMGVDESEAAEALNLTGCFSPRSLDAPGRHSEASSLLESLGEADDGFELAEMRATLSDAVLNLSDRDRLILRLRFFDGLTQQQIGDAIGVTQMQVSRLLSRILRDLRKAVDAEVAA